MERYLIIADDFTGASDTGMQLCRYGYAPRVLFGAGEIADAADGCVLDTESRALPSAEAEQAVLKMLDRVPLTGFDRVIKKVDSTLRGNIAAETRAVDGAYQSELVLFMPALPDLGRSTVDGVHLLNGVRITDTELARDPLSPVREDRLNKLMQAAFPNEAVRSFSLAEIRTDGISFGGARVFCCDAETNADMQRVLHAALATGRRTLFIGTAAIADNLLALSASIPPALAVISSVSKTTEGQVRYAARSAAVLEVAIGQILAGEATEGPFISEAVRLLSEGRDLILLSDATLARQKLDSAMEIGAALGMDPAQVGLAAQRIMGNIARETLSQTRVSGLFLAGGDTAMGVLAALGATGAEIRGEALTGIPLLTLSGGMAEGMKTITKAGAFGGEDAIAFCLRKLKA